MNYLARILPLADRIARVPAPSNETMTAKKIWSMVSGAWQRMLQVKGVRGTARRLRVVERVPLGDKQFIALLELDGARYLATGGPGVPISVTPAQNADTAQETGAAFVFALKPDPTLQAADPEPKRIRTRSTIPQKKPATSKRAATRAATQSAESAAAECVKEVVHQAAVPEMSAASTPTRKKRVHKTPRMEPKIRERRAVSLAPERAEVQANGLPIKTAPDPHKVIKPPKSIAKTQRQTPLSKRRVAASAVDALARSNKTPGEEPAPGTVPSASTAFAALLELRTLASQVFEELDANTGLENPTVAPAPIGATKREMQAAAVHEQKEPNRVLSRLHRRLSAYGCLLILFVVPFGAARAQASPGFSPVASRVIVTVPGSSFELGAIGANLLAEAPLPNGDIRITGLGGSSASWSIVVLLTLLTLIPALLLCITPFARLLIVFHFLRQALGLQTTPSNQTLIGLSLILTFFLMQPTGEVIYRDVIVPAQAGKLTPLDAVVRAGDPMRHFMAHYVREKDAELFLEIAKEPRPRTVEDMSFRVLLPSYILSELKAGFQIGTVLFLPFLIVDMVVASITTSVGMMQLPPVVISTPLKLLLFLMVDGWHLLIGALMRSFS